MLTKLRITYWLAQAAPVHNSVATYPAISVSFDYDSEGKLTAVTHELDRSRRYYFSQSSDSHFSRSTQAILGTP